MLDYFRLLRPINLCIIGLTMYSVAFFFDGASLNTVTSFNFLFIVLSIILIAGAGNVINDYFDIEIDKINKPEKQIVGKTISKKESKLFYFSLNLSSLIFTFLSCRQLSNYWFLLINLAQIILLWLYSAQFKKKILVGNFIVALLIGCVPLFVVLFFQIKVSTVYFHLEYFSENTTLFSFGLTFGIFAFLLNFTREIIKDIEDLEGDRQFSANTFPIRFGIKMAKKTALFFSVATITLLISLIFLIEWKSQIQLIPIILILILLLFSIYQIIQSKEKKQFHSVSNLIKLIMLIGILSPIYWILL